MCDVANSSVGPKDASGKLAYVRVATFNKQTTESAKAALRQLKADGATRQSSSWIGTASSCCQQGYNTAAVMYHDYVSAARYHDHVHHSFYNTMSCMDTCAQYTYRISMHLSMCSVYLYICCVVSHAMRKGMYCTSYSIVCSCSVDIPL